VLSPEWWHWIVLGLALTIAESDHAELVLLPADIQSTLRRFSRRVVKTGN
jgi:pheromone shutdown protein TraB